MSSSSTSRGAQPPSGKAPQRGRGAWLVAAAFVAGAALGYGYFQHGLQARSQAESEQAAALRAALGRADAEAMQLRSQLDAAAGELAVERAARDEMARELTKAQESLGEARDRLAFYELLVPPGPQGALEVRALEVQPDAGALRYRVLLTRNARQGAAFNGTLQFMAAGTRHGKPANEVLLPMRVEPAAGAEAASGNPSPAVQFTQYQRSQGLLALPEGFVPKALTVRVLEGDAVRASRTAEVPAAPG